MVRKKKGNWTGWLGYTWSKTERKFNDVNFGRVFPYRYDRRHDVSLAITYKASERIDWGFVWVYGTGNAVTLPEARYIGGSANINQNINFSSEFDHIQDRNGYRMPAYHRLDVGVNVHKDMNWGTRTWSFGLYNAYNRQNPFFLQFEREFNVETQQSENKLFQYSLFQLIPSISYQFDF